MRGIAEVFFTFLRLGCVAFGGPVAHMGYYRTWFVQRRDWIDDQAFARLMALCQFLPGPASTQVAFGIGQRRAGLAGGFAAWLGFSLPSVMLMIAFAVGVSLVEDLATQGWVVGLKVAAFAIIVHAVIGMARSLSPDPPRWLITALATVSALLFAHPLGQIATLIAGGALALAIVRTPQPAAIAVAGPAPRGRTIAASILLLFGAGLLGLPALAALAGSPELELLAILYRVGALVFGGGHVVLPLLETELVRPGLIAPEPFLAGYGAAQAVPGPVFTFAAYLGASIHPQQPVLWGLLSTLALFLPGLLLVAGVAPFWDRLAGIGWVAHALLGINAAVVGLLAAVVVYPVAPATLLGTAHAVLALAALAALLSGRIPAYAVVLGCALAGVALF
jgi:chromate transporter